MFFYTKIFSFSGCPYPQRKRFLEDLIDILTKQMMDFANNNTDSKYVYCRKVTICNKFIYIKKVNFVASFQQYQIVLFEWAPPPPTLGLFLRFIFYQDLPSHTHTNTQTHTDTDTHYSADF